MKGHAWRILIGLALTAALLLAALPSSYAAPVTTAATGPVRNAGTGLTLPMTLGGLQLASVTDFENTQAGAGYSYRYRDAGNPLLLDLYIYNKNASIPSGASAPLIVAEVESAIREVRAVAAQGLYKNLVIADTGSVCRFGDLEFRCVTLRFDLNGRPVQSLLLLRGDRGNFIKMRATWSVDDVNAAATVQRWATALAGFLKP